MYKKFNLFKILSMAGFFISAASVILTPWSYSFDPYHGSQLVSLLSGTFFWAGLIVGTMFEILSAKERKHIPESKTGRVGVLNFFKNVEAIIADIVLVVSIAVYAVFDNPYVQTVGLFGIFAGFCFHCIFNGLNYRTLKNIYKKEKNDEEDHNEKN